MTDKLFHQDSYLKEFQAVVVDTSPDDHGLILDRTAFYPGGGGQPSDQGWLLIDTKRTELAGIKIARGQILHLLSPAEKLPIPGTALTGYLDWDRRYQLMRTHTAMHILCGTIFRDYSASVTGGNMTPLQGRMDFEFASLEKELVQSIEDAVNEEIARGLEVTWRTVPREEAFQIPDLIRTKINLLPEKISEVRIVEIDGLDLQADGGTHVKNTAEVGRVKVTDYKSKGRDNKRIYLEVSDN